MSVEMAREAYGEFAGSVLRHRDMCADLAWPECPACRILGGLVDAASLTLDLQVAEESRQRTRDSVAW